MGITGTLTRKHGMDNQQEEQIYRFNSKEELSPDYQPVKVWNLLQFFRLSGKKTVLAKDNLEPIPGLKYLLFSPAEKIYYLKEYRGYSVDELYFYRRTLTFSGEDIAIVNLRNYVLDGNIYLLFDENMVQDTKEMLARVSKSYFHSETELKYKTFINILSLSIDLEDYRTYSSNLTGFKTVCNQFEQKIAALWQSCLKN